MTTKESDRSAQLRDQVDVLRNRERLNQEFEQIRGESEDGKLYPEQAVRWAKKNRNSFLHSQIEWDDRKAADAYRIEQVRGLIRVVVIQSEETGKTVRAYVSQPSDRTHGGGYRPITEALAQARLELVDEALVTIEQLKDRYTHLPELSPLFTQLEAVVAGYRASRLAKTG